MQADGGSDDGSDDVNMVVAWALLDLSQLKVVSVRVRAVTPEQWYVKLGCNRLQAHTVSEWISACSVHGCLLPCLQSREQAGSTCSLASDACLGTEYLFYFILFIVTSAQLRSQCYVWLALKASL